MAHIAEQDCDDFAKAMNYLIIPCDLCGSQYWLKCQQMKAILDDWEASQPGRRQILFRALTDACPSHLLDPKLFYFKGLILDPASQEINPPD